MEFSLLPLNETSSSSGFSLISANATDAFANKPSKLCEFHLKFFQHLFESEGARNRVPQLNGLMNLFRVSDNR